MGQFRFAVTGGRNFDDKKHVFDTLDAIRSHYIDVILVVGDAKGADALARKWAKKRGVPVEVYEADWAFGASAGPMRNARILLQGDPSILVAFPGGRGTLDMINRTKRAGRRVIFSDDVQYALSECV
jgi:hypothetical protein